MATFMQQRLKKVKLLIYQCNMAEKNSTNLIYDAFISYSILDVDWVDSCLLPKLETGGLKVCVDYRDFEIGVPKLENMEYGVEKSRKTLLVLTPSWVRSEWTNFEVLLAQTQDPAGRGRRLLPLMVVTTELPRRLEMLTYLDMTNNADFDFQMKRLINTIQNTELYDETSYISSDASPFTSTAPNRSYSLSSNFNYLQGLMIMNNQMQTSDLDTRLTFAMLDSRLRANLHDENMFGSSETLRSERNRIVYELNRFALIHLQKTFNEICGA